MAWSARCSIVNSWEGLPLSPAAGLRDCGFMLYGASFARALPWQLLCYGSVFLARALPWQLLCDR